jgi:hypothetical protein
MDASVEAAAAFTDAVQAGLDTNVLVYGADVDCAEHRRCPVRRSGEHRAGVRIDAWGPVATGVYFKRRSRRRSPAYRTRSEEKTDDSPAAPALLSREANHADTSSPVSRALYLINPASDFPTYFSAEVFAARGLRPATYMADLATTTLAAMATPHLHVDICDENVTAIDFDHDAEYVGITGKLTQYTRMVAVAQRFRAAGKTVLIGGPCASLSPDLLRAHCDILVRGEIEEISDELFSALRAGTWKDEYVGTRPDLAGSPTPRWDKYPNHRAMSGTLQTSRGCPFECEFCDVIQYLGRKQRHKPIAQVLHELDALYRHGYRSVFLADDNFTVYRSRAKELLAAMRAWNERQPDGPVHFITQVSVDAARDDELLRMCAAAGLRQVFIGPRPPTSRACEKPRRDRISTAISSQRCSDSSTTASSCMRG